MDIDHGLASCHLRDSILVRLNVLRMVLSCLLNLQHYVLDFVHFFIGVLTEASIPFYAHGPVCDVFVQPLYLRLNFFFCLVILHALHLQYINL